MTDGHQKGFEDQISSAIASHSLWKKDLLAAIDSGRFHATPEAVEDCAECKFGRWLDSVPDGWRDDAFVNVYKVHREFHYKAAAVLRLALAGEREESLASLAQGSEYARVSVALIMALAGWRSQNKGRFVSSEPNT